MVPLEHASILELTREPMAQRLDREARRRRAISGKEIGAPLPGWSVEGPRPGRRLAGAHGPPR